MSQQITAAQLKAIAGAGARADLIAAIVRGWPNAVAKAKLSTRNRACHFLAQIMTETGGLQILEESGAYRWQRIMEIFGVGHHSARVTEAEARRIGALPVSQRGPVLFNRVYGTGNPTKMREFNNTGPNDGWLYRGGGMMQATGKSNYAAMEKKTGLPLVAHPELLHQPDSAFTAAYLEWAQDGRCNTAADRDDVVTVRRIINGGSNGLAECRKFLAKAKQVLADYSAAPIAAFVPAADDLDGAIDSSPPLVPGANGEDAPAVTGDTPAGNPELLAVKKILKGMNYTPGVLNDEWGGMTAGAIAGFINDRGGHIPVPASLEAFNEVKADIRSELQRAQDEVPAFVRPVSDARKTADPATVATVAPEVVPVKRNFLASAWAAVVAFVTAIGTTISSYVSAAWNWLTNNKDSLPSDPGYLSTAWSYVSHVPVAVWIFLAAGGLTFLAVNSFNSARKITESVKTGARQ